eukprot:TRINITY_DN8392_c0_g3_i2.p1 TRINITY_DN8392_c0_g3~~TRINITY_DN8392_c0_g3_i2.p1  ORF type:complete len:293 (-),score=-7.84 TRINITY_DN8392_c0_g3_i2:85-963(-)
MWAGVPSEPLCLHTQSLATAQAQKQIITYFTTTTQKTLHLIYKIPTTLNQKTQNHQNNFGCNYFSYVNIEKKNYSHNSSLFANIFYQYSKSIITIIVQLLISYSQLLMKIVPLSPTQKTLLESPNQVFCIYTYRINFKFEFLVPNKKVYRFLVVQFGPSQSQDILEKKFWVPSVTNYEDSTVLGFINVFNSVTQPIPQCHFKADQDSNQEQLLSEGLKNHKNHVITIHVQLVRTEYLTAVTFNNQSIIEKTSICFQNCSFKKLFTCSVTKLLSQYYSNTKTSHKKSNETLLG